MSRPFAAIDEIKEVHDAIVLDRGSMTRIIQNSGVLSNVFHDNCTKTEQSAVSGKRIKNLQFRKHRFDSVQKPTSRAVLFIDALIATAIWATVHRRGQRDAVCAEKFLKFIDERKLILLSMIADAADECIQVVRFLDTESYDLSELLLQLQTCMSRLHYLFIEDSFMFSGFEKG